MSYLKVEFWNVILMRQEETRRNSVHGLKKGRDTGVRGRTGRVMECSGLSRAHIF